MMLDFDSSDLPCSIGKLFFLSFRLRHFYDNRVQFFLRIDAIINPNFRCLDWYYTIKQNFCALNPVADENSLVKNEKRAK